MQNEVASSPPYGVTSVDNALRLVLLLQDRPEIQVRDAAEFLDVSRSTAHRLLTMLRYRGFATQDPQTRAYRAGQVLLSLGLSVARQVDIRRYARPHLLALHEQFGETVHLTVLEGNSVRFIDGLVGTHALRVGDRTGMLLSAHSTAGGKALLAQLDFEDVRAMFPRGMTAITGQTLTTLARLQAELESIRRRGYATNFDESADGVSAIAAPVRAPSGEAAAALAAAIPTSRLARSRVPAIAGAVMAAAAATEADLIAAARAPEPGGS
jgi:DNA-binding IclR family transcriptional regulator